MNKKILTIIFTLFVAGLLTVSCSSKDKTGPGDGGTTPTIPTIPENGTGIDSGYRGRMYFTGNTSYGEGTVTVTLDGAPLYTFNKLGEFQIDMPKGDGDVLVKMPKLTEIGFTGDIIKIPAKNIVEGEGNNYTVKTRYTFGDAATKIVTFDLESERFNIDGAYLKMKVKLTKTTTEKDKDPVTAIYTIEVDLRNKTSGADSIDGTGAILPKY